MIYIEIYGGLGNQMFQFATACSLAFKKRTTVGIFKEKMPRINDDKFTTRQFELTTVFTINNFVVVNDSEIEHILTKQPDLAQKIKRKILRISYVFEKDLTYQKEFELANKNSFLSGYFQSYKYFQNYRDLILENFTFKQRPNDQTLQLLEKIKNKVWVTLHIRRGDYLRNSQNLATHGVCSVAYYSQAIEFFKSHKIDHYLFISDEPDWVKTQIKLPDNSIVVDWNRGSDSWQDMYIMTKSTHVVIANSSFSWWGAYLNNNSNKIIIAPSRWYADPVKQSQTKDLIPPEWIRID